MAMLPWDVGVAAAALTYLSQGMTWQELEVLVGLTALYEAFDHSREFERLMEAANRGRKRLSPSPPSEPAVQFSRDGLSSQLFPHRDWRAN